jgi:hypothetical protein
VRRLYKSFGIKGLTNCATSCPRQRDKAVILRTGPVEHPVAGVQLMMYSCQTAHETALLYQTAIRA